MEPRTFYVSYEKFSRIYILYPVLFALICWGDLRVMEWLALTVALTVAAILGSKLAFRTFIRGRTAITVTDTALETPNLDGTLHAIPFTELLGPFEDKLGPIRRFKFMRSTDTSGRDATKLIIVTNLTEGFEELITLIQQKISDAQQK